MDADSLVFAPEGDVVLVVGGEQFRIHADSLFLKRHSTVFAALLGPNFREGQDLNTSSPKEITLADDDSYAMTAICATMYHDFDHIPQSATTDQVLSIIRLADKYDCCDVLTLPSQVHGWLKSDHLTLGKDLVNILAMAYLVRDKEAFKDASIALVSKYDGSFADLADNVICDVLPWKTFCRLEGLRARIQTLAISISLAAKPRSYGHPSHSGCSKLGEGIQENFSNDLLAEVRQIHEQKHRERSYRTLPHPKRQSAFGQSREKLLATQQSAIGPLVEKLQELAKACNECNKNVKASQLDTFCLSLAGNNLRQVAMLPEWYWGLNLTD